MQAQLLLDKNASRRRHTVYSMEISTANTKLPVACIVQSCDQHMTPSILGSHTGQKLQKVVQTVPSISIVYTGLGMYIDTPLLGRKYHFCKS